jgi:hypothetical protein
MRVVSHISPYLITVSVTWVKQMRVENLLTSEISDNSIYEEEVRSLYFVK